jgi:hypothetical protein
MAGQAQECQPRLVQGGAVIIPPTAPFRYGSDDYGEPYSMEEKRGWGKYLR